MGRASQVALWSEPKLADWQPMPDPELSLDVLYEDDHLVAVAKASGIPSVPLHPREPGTLAGAVVARFPRCAGLGRSPGDGGLVHRLDRETSGVVLAALNRDVYERLWAAQQGRRLEKRYLALLRNLQENRVFRREEVVKWRCRNCGYVHEGKEAPEICPACAHPQSYYELMAENY